MVTVTPMNRRHFIQAASLLIPGGVTLGRTNAASAAQPAPDRVFFDERFPQARQLASSLVGEARLTPVQADITYVWNAWLSRACRQSPLTLRGVTTESFHFCLNVMVGDHVGVDTQIARVDRDLHLWTLRTLQ